MIKSSLRKSKRRKSKRRKSKRRKSPIKKRSRSLQKSRARKSPIKKRSQSNPKARARKSPIKKRSRSNPKSRRRKSPIKKRLRSLRKSRRRKSPIKKRSQSNPKARARKSRNNYSPPLRTRTERTDLKGRERDWKGRERDGIGKKRKYKIINPTASSDIPEKFKKFLTDNNRPLLEKISTKFLLDEDIYKIFEIIFPEPTEQCVGVDTNLTACFFVSGHGSEGYKGRSTIIEKIIKKLEKFEFKKNIDEDDLKEYIKNSVFMIISMGMVGVSSIMQTQTNFGFRPEYTTSELDIVIPKTFFSVFDKYNKAHENKIKLNNENLDLLHSLIKYQLRLNFYKIWLDSPIAIREKSYPEIFQLIKRKEIWVLKELTSDSLERTYSLVPNKGENPKLYAHEGLHIIDIRRTTDDETMTDETMTDEKKRDKMIQQLSARLPSREANESLSRTFKKEKRKRTITEEERIFNLIMEKKIKKKTWLKLSTIIMIGYILGIKKLYIYDPACRPIFKSNGDENKIPGAVTDRSMNRVDSFG